MGMCLGLHSVSDENIQKILSSPPLIWLLLAPDDPDMYEEEVQQSNRGGFLSKVFRKKEESDLIEVPVLNFVEGENIEDDLDKSWHGIHYCLNQTQYKAEPPMDFIMDGGELAGNIDVGYGPARLLINKQVKEIENIITGISREKLYSNYNPSEMEKLEIYPSIWEREGDEAFDYLAEYFETLKSFVRNCSKNNLGMAIYLC